MALDIKTNLAMREDLIRLQGEVDQKNLSIANLSTEKTRLLAEKEQLAEQLSVVKGSLEATKSELLSAAQAHKAELGSLAGQLEQRTSEIKSVNMTLSSREKELAELKVKYAELVDKGSSKEAILTELSDLRIQNEFHKAQLLSRNQYFQQLTLDLEKFRAESARMGAERDGMEKVLQAEQNKRALLEQELTSVRGRAEFSSSELSGYLNNAIDTFNSQVNLADSSVNYIISELQVDLKAAIGTTGGSALTMVAPSQSQLTEQGLSSFKFTIRAVPQSTE